MVINMRSRKAIIFLAMFLMFGLLRSAFAATAYVDRNTVSLNETFVLTLTVENISFGGTPDLKSIENDFTVLGTSQSTSMNLINGTSSRKTEWITTLAPRRVGTFTIPSIRIGKEQTNPLTIIVSRAPKVISTQKNEIFFEVEIDRRQGYVQQQFVYTLKRYASRQFGVSAFSHVGDENFKDDRLLVKQIGDTSRYMSNLGGTEYDVAELKYLIFPQQAGKITLPAPRMVAVIETGRRNRRDPFARRQQKQIQILGEDIELNISSIPNTYGSNWWLPAKKVSITQNWSTGLSQLKVGEPITRTITVTALGLSAEQLPDLSSITLNNAKIYPDKVERETAFNGKDVIGKSVHKMLIIPSAGGKLTIPETSITWWDIAQNCELQAKLPAQVLNIAPVVQQEQAPAKQPPAEKNETAAIAVQTEEQVADVLGTAVETIVETQSRWYLELGLLILLIVALAGWVFDHLRLKRKAVKIEAEDIPLQKKQKEKQLRQQLKQACQTADAKSVRQALLVWGDELIEGKSNVTLLDIEQYFNDSVLQNEINRLENALYGDGELGWNGANLWLVVENAIESLDEKSKDKSGGLEELHKI